MPRPRKQQISLEATPFYHCVSRCVRRAFLCGVDSVSGRSYEHRRHLIQQDLLRLASLFYIDVAAFAVMSNHSEKFINNEHLEPYELNQIDVLVDTWRSRLYDISWFMKVLNENIARLANKEDECTGHFWESRFKSQALLDENAVLSAMAYVDLNPIRAAMADTPENSDHTSIQLRIEYWKKKANRIDSDSTDTMQPKSLLPFVGSVRQPMPKGLIFNLIDYIELVDWTGRTIRDDKRGAIPESARPILQRLEISEDHWIELSTSFEKRFKGIAGSVDSIKMLCAHFGLTRATNRSNSKLLYG